MPHAKHQGTRAAQAAHGTLRGLHLDFEENLFVYLFWSCQAPPTPPAAPFFPTATECSDPPALGADTDPFSNADLLAVPFPGNRVDRYVWDDSTDTLTFDSNLIVPSTPGTASRRR